MDARHVVKAALDTGVYLYLENGQLAFKAKSGQFSPELRNVVRQHRDGIVAYLAEQGRNNRLAIEPLRQRHYPLSHAQRRLHFLTQLQQGSANYNLRAALKLHGELNRPALVGALNALVERHEILRTTYELVGEKVQQRVNAAQPLAIEEIDLRGLTRAAQEQALQTLVAEEARRQFDLLSDCMMAVRLVTLGAACHAVLLTIHHIATDGTSMTILTREFMQLYQALRHGRPDPLPALPFQFGDFAAWQQGASGEAVLSEQLAYWREALAGVPTLHQLPLDKPRPAQPDHVGQVHLQMLDADLTRALETLAQRHQCTLFIVVKALFALLLAKLSASRDIVIGTPVAGRNQQGTQALVGFFANTLVFRHALSDFEMSFGELLAQHRAQASAVFSHQDVPFEKLVEELQVERRLNCHPLFQIFLAFQNYEQESLVLEGLAVEPVVPRTHNIRFDLELTVHTSAQGLRLQWAYAIALFDISTLERLSASFEVLARQVVADDAKPLWQLRATSALDAQYLTLWNRTERKPAAGLVLPDLIVRQAQLTPEAIAVEDGEQRLSYRQLLGRADALAQVLRAKGVGSGCLVGVYLPRTIDLVVGLLGILRSGGAYVPLDPSYPAARLAYIAQDSRFRCIVTHGSLGTDVATDIEAVLVDRITAEAREPLADVEVTPEQLAYVIYTSGSTGRPKGVMVEHRQLSNFLHAMQESLKLERGAWLAVTASSFDISILELLCPLAWGFTVVVADHQHHTGARQSFAQLMTAHAVTHFQCTPSLLRMYMELPEFCRAMSQLETILVGGEECPVSLVGRVAQHTRARMMNMYGPTETTIWSSCAELHDGRAVSIGRPIANTQFYVVDEWLQPVPLGVQGELLIGGEGVSRGYLGRPELTADRFIVLNTADGASVRVYRTGDRVRWRPEGVLEYLGRMDHQVKLHGYRIELGEIEAQLRSHEAVKEAVVQAQEDDLGEKRLVAYLTLTGQASAEQVRAHLSSALPPYMVPRAFVMLESLPLTANGKVDRTALPKVIMDEAVEYQAPRTDTERALAQIWQELLETSKPVSASANFFRLGGHSLLATRMLLAISRHTRVDLPLKDVFELQTLADLARHIELKSKLTAVPDRGSHAKGTADHVEIEW